ncbi:MAG TPA: hypothetical protein EYN67_13515 [Flavobacteriales bacterium]|nr:hypothetical protein [Flavobacteriales bacterium]
MKEKLFVSFSGGETSGRMSYLLQTKYSSKFDLVFIFANTGQENEETLKFVNKCDKEFNLNVVWVEAVVNPIKGKGIRHKIVNFKTASRNGEPFEAVISKEGIPNRTSPHCSSRLKTLPIKDYIKSLGAKNYKMAIGIRTDEQKRVSKKAAENGLIYPLIDLVPNDKQDVNCFWEDQSFRLNLENHEGNCKTCWKKSDKKLWLIALESPERYNFMRKMEEEYRSVNEKRQEFFRGKRTTDTLIGEAQVMDAYTLRRMIGADTDGNSGCSESCDGFSE